MMALEIIECTQGTAEWFQARMGMPTASNFKELLVKPKKGDEHFGKGALTYMYKLAGERIMGEPQQNYNNEHMQRGHDNEPYARHGYYFAKGVVVELCGYMVNHGAGYSPDGLVKDDGIIEIKDKLPHLQIQTILENVAPKEHMAQMQGGLWISEREWCDFISYCPRLMKPFIKRVHRDEKMIERISDAVRRFNYELELLCDKLKKWEEMQ